MNEKKYIWQNEDFPRFCWDKDKVFPLLLAVKRAQGELFGNAECLSAEAGQLTLCEVLSQDVLRSSEIEGVKLEAGQVRSSVARRLGVKLQRFAEPKKDVDGFVFALFDATQNCKEPLSEKRVCSWQAAMFPEGFSEFYKIKTGSYRDDSLGAMQVVSGSVGHERVFFEAPPAKVLTAEMQKLMDFVNFDAADDVLKAAVAHLWFVTLHPFDDGNGRIARILSDMLLARGEGAEKRFYSMSAQICRARKSYYKALEITGQPSLDITDWIVWFLENLLCAVEFAKSEIAQTAHRQRLAEKFSMVPMNERQTKFLQKLLGGFDGKVTSSKYAKLSCCSQDSALRDLTDLVAKGVLQKEGAGRSVCYTLNGGNSPI